MSYQPKQRQVRARLATPAGWIKGTLHVPSQHSFLDFVNHGGPFLKLTDVSLPDGREQSFFALRRSAVDLMVPEVDESELQLHHPSTGAYQRHEIGCVFANGTMHGTLGVLENVRVSDYLLHHKGFCLMRSCETHGGEGSKEDLVLVNTDQVIGMWQTDDDSDSTTK